MHIVRDIKRIIEKKIDREYWYNHRKITNLWFDDDDKKWHDSKYPGHARTVTDCTWEGEWDLWCSMLLKLDHMFWNIKTYGVEANYYFYSGDIEEYANDNDKRILAKKVIQHALLEKKEILSNKLWLFSVDVDRKYSDNGKAEFYLQTTKDFKHLVLTVKTNELIPPKQIKKKDKMYTIDSYIDENGKRQWTHKEAEQYRRKFGEVLNQWELPEKDAADFILDKIDTLATKRCKDYAREVFDGELDFNVNMMDIAMNRLDQYCPSFEIEEMPLFSEELKKHATGNFVKCRDMLHLRHLIKKLLETSEDDMKYDYLFINERDEEKRSAGFKEAVARYNADREAAYKRVMDFMREKSRNWWD